MLKAYQLRDSMAIYATKPRPGDLAPDGADIAVARHGLALAGGFVVTGTHPGPLGKSVCGAEGRHVGADFDEPLGGGEAIDTGKGYREGLAAVVERLPGV
jgi:hypothetical protein